MADRSALSAATEALASATEAAQGAGTARDALEKLAEWVSRMRKAVPRRAFDRRATGPGGTTAADAHKKPGAGLDRVKVKPQPMTRDEGGMVGEPDGQAESGRHGTRQPPGRVCASVAMPVPRDGGMASRWC